MSDSRSADAPGKSQIVVVGPAYPLRGGIAQFTDALSGALSRRSHDVSVTSFSRQYPKLLFPGTSQYERDASRTATAAADIDSINPLSWWSTGARIAAGNPSAVIFQYWLPFFAPAYGMIARQVRRRAPDARLIAMAHNVFPHERRPGDAALGRYFLRTCDAIVALSAAVAEDARAIAGAADVRILAHPVYDHFGPARPRDEARRALGIPADAEVLLFFGFIRRYKGLHVLLRALPSVVRERPSVHLVVAGEFYEDEDAHRSLIRSSGVEDRVHVFSEYIPESEVPAFFSAADLVVQPYLSATQSGVVQTAFHFERPVVVTDVGGLAEVVPHEQAGLVVPPDDPEALARAIERFFADDMADRLADGVRREKRKYGWDAFCEAIEELMPHTT